MTELKKQKDVNIYLFPWVLFTVTSILFYVAEAWIGYLYILEQFFSMSKYFSYLYGLILLTEVFRRSIEEGKNNPNHTEKDRKKNKRRKLFSAAERRRAGKKKRTGRGFLFGK